MSRYNLLKEPWIKVIDDNNKNLNVSILEIFKNARNYKRLSNDTSAQDFAILRLLLAIMHTVMSRYQLDGTKYEADTDDLEDTWKSIWQNDHLPFKIIENYLLSWEDRFYLYDNKYPFYQVTAHDLQLFDIKKTSTISGKLINRTISESENKVDLFSPTKAEYKNKLTDAMLARWLVTFQGYTGTSDKAKFPNMTVSASKGWLLGLGGIYLQYNNLFNTLMINCVIKDNTDDYIPQVPIWERSNEDKINHLNYDIPNNLADLYTNLSRLIVIDPDMDPKENVTITAVQLPKLELNNFNLEPMTIWYKPKTGQNKGKVMPKEHDLKRPLWKSSQLLLPNKDRDFFPGIIDFYISNLVQLNVQFETVKITAVGMAHNNDASNSPNDDIYDELVFHQSFINDVKFDKTANKINIEVEIIDRAITALGYFAENIVKINGSNNKEIKDNLVDQAYFMIDEPFKQWVADLISYEDLNQKVNNWHKDLYRILANEANSLIRPLNNRDFLGKYDDKKKRILNVIYYYSIFKNQIRKIILKEG